MTENEIIEYVQHCITNVQAAMAREDYNNAKLMLQKAERALPTDTAKRLEILCLIKDKDCIEGYDRIAAEKCITIARLALAMNDKEKAVTYLTKSILMHPLNEANDLIERLYSQPIRPSGTVEEAEKCNEKALVYFHEGNLKKALRLLTKSQRLFSTTIAKDLLRQVRETMIHNGDDPDEVLKEKKVFVKKNVDPPPQPKKRETTAQQINEIERVMQASCDYEILGIPKGSSWDTVKKTYQQLTVLLHPDKNKHPGANEAYMKVKCARDSLKK